MPTVRTAKHLLLESTTKSVESGTNDVICQFCTVKGMVVESEVLKAQNCALSKFSLPVHCNGEHSIDSAFKLSCSIIEAYLNHLYSSQLITPPVYTFNSQTKENITTKRRRSFALHLKPLVRLISMNSAYECIITTRSFHRTRNEL